jgi:hypothetical protein
LLRATHLEVRRRSGMLDGSSTRAGAGNED